MKGVIKFSNYARSREALRLSIVSDCGEICFIKNSEKTPEYLELLDSPVEVFGQIERHSDGTEEFDVQGYRLLFPLQHQFSDNWYFSDSSYTSPNGEFKGYRL